MPKSIYTIAAGQIMTVTPVGNVQVYRPGSAAGGFLASATSYGPYSAARQMYVDGSATVSFADVTDPASLRGTFTANGASTVNVANTNVAAADNILISLNTVGGTVGAVPAIVTLTPGTGFGVKGTASDTSVYNYVIFKNVA